MINRLKNTSLLISLTILVFIAAVLMTATLLFIVGVSISNFHLFIAIGITVVFSWFATKAYFPERFFSYLAVVLLVPSILFMLFLWVSGNFYDLSYDGQSYHQEAIIYLNNGWNPVYDAPLTVSTGHAIWINHYAKASEICAAVLYAVTGHIEQSKLFNLLLIAGSFFAALAALLTYDVKRLDRTIPIALLLACNPVSVYQALSFYVDGQLASLLLYLLALGSLVFMKGDRWVVIAFSLSIILTVNNKFTALGYAAVIGIGLVVALYMSEQFTQMKKLIAAGLVSAILAIAVIGFNPYVTNTIRHGHPFYPLAGPQAKDVVEDFTPKSFFSMNRVQSAIVSYLSVAEENSTTNAGTTLKIPFTINDRELTRFTEPDVAVAGFGPFFGGALILSLIILLLSLRLNVTRSLAVIGILLIVLASVFINSAAWWARYVPQFWTVPLILAALGLSYEKKKAIQACSWGLLAVLAVNILLIAYTYVGHQYAWTQALKRQLEALQQSPQPISANFGYSWSNRIRFDALGIIYKEQKDGVDCAGKITLYRSGTTVCPPTSQSPQ